MGPRTVIYNRPQIHLLRGPDAYVRLILDRKCTLRAGVDWRAGRMKEFIDSHPERVPRDVTDLCKQIGLSLSVVRAVESSRCPPVCRLECMRITHVLWPPQSGCKPQTHR